MNNLIKAHYKRICKRGKKSVGRIFLSEYLDRYIYLRESGESLAEIYWNSVKYRQDFTVNVSFVKNAMKEIIEKSNQLNYFEKI